MNQRLTERFLTVALVPNGECLDWPGEVDKDGYGVVRAGHRRSGGVRGRAPRVAWAVAHPDEPLPVVVRHTCDRPRCVSPAHLLAGSQVENQRDSVDRGRWRGGKGGLAALTPVPCPECGTPFLPRVIRKGVRQATCSKACGAIRREKGTHCGSGT